MHGHEKSDRPVVPASPPNKAAQAAAEAGEGSGLGKENATSATRPGHSAGLSVPSALGRVRRVAKQDRKVRFTALLHHVDVDRLRTAYWALNPKAATGVDGVTWQDYGQDLEANLRDLHARVHRGAYRARPSRRVYIPKADGRQRPLGVAALEDKLLQRAVVEVLNAVYETDFLGFSYGFRPGRSPHQALDALATGILRRKVSWVLDADIRGFYDAIDHGWLLRFLEHRIADKRLVRLIRKWLKAGVIENGEWSETPEGTAQGASVSPLLANVYLHYVFDLWADQWRRRHAHGDVVIVRFADDYIVGFQHRDDAERFLAELRGRLAKFNLELASEKTRLIEFGRFAAERRQKRGLGKPETFAFLGFTHMCGKRRTTGMKKGMKELYTEGLAIHGGPDHALATREGAAKRWAGVHTGRAMEPRNCVIDRGADAVADVGRQHRWWRFREPSVDPAGSENQACVRSLHAENREVSRSPACGDGRAGRAGKAKAVIP